MTETIYSLDALLETEISNTTTSEKSKMNDSLMKPFIEKNNIDKKNVIQVDGHLEEETSLHEKSQNLDHVNQSKGDFTIIIDLAKVHAVIQCMKFLNLAA